MSKSQRQREDELALSKNHGDKIRYKKRQLEEQEAAVELEEVLQELNRDSDKVWPRDYIS